LIAVWVFKFVSTLITEKAGKISQSIYINLTNSYKKTKIQITAQEEKYSLFENAAINHTFTITTLLR